MARDDEITKVDLEEIIRKLKKDRQEEDPLRRSDLGLYMDAYKNMIEFSTTVLEKQKILIEKIEEIIINQKNIISDIEKEKTLIGEINKKMVEDDNNRELSRTKDIGSLRNQIYISWGTMGGIIISLIWVIMNLVDKNQLLLAIAKKLGVGITN